MDNLPLEPLTFPLNEIVLNEMKLQSFDEVDKESLVDMRSIVINQKEDAVSRVLDVTTQLKNPFFCKHGKYVVKSNYHDDLPSITEVGNRIITI